MTVTDERVQRTMGLSRTADGRPVPSAHRRLARRPPSESRWVSWVATLLVTAVAGFLRLWHLERPAQFLFDETYYAKDAWSLLQFGYVRDYVSEADKKILAGELSHDALFRDGPSMIVHPEVGKWLIALGEHAFGMTPYGWRFSAAVVGTLMVLVMVRLARRLTGSTLLGCLAGMLLARGAAHVTETESGERESGESSALRRLAAGEYLVEPRMTLDARVRDVFAQSPHWQTAEEGFVPDGEGHWRLDVARINRRILEQAGVPGDRIFESRLCTACDLQRFYSYRVEGAGTGRLIAGIVSNL